MYATSPTRCPDPGRSSCARGPAASAAPTFTCSSTARRWPSSARSCGSTRRPSPSRRCGWSPTATSSWATSSAARSWSSDRTARTSRPGDLVVSIPVAFDAAGLHTIGYSNEYPGGYAEFMVLSDLAAMKVPNGLDHRRAALTEPLAVGIHAVAKSKIAPGDAAVVLGCGPVGLAVIDDLARRGIEPIVASDFSPARRALAAKVGAHEVVDPSSRAPDRRLAARRRREAARDLRGGRRARHDRPGDADGAA